MTPKAENDTPAPLPFRFLSALATIILVTLSIFSQTTVQAVGEGDFIRQWLISDALPGEIDAGTWENFNRFNIERLPQKDWLRPFPPPRAGVLNADPALKTDAPRTVGVDGNPLPEIGAATSAGSFPDVSRIEWRDFAAPEARLDFFRHFGGKTIGTVYLARTIESDEAATRFLETDGFLGAVWVNGKLVYDGYRLNPPKIAAVGFSKGANRILVRASGVRGDYWRKDGGWTALLRWWSDRAAAESAAALKSSRTPGTIYFLEGFHVDPVYLQDQRGYSKVTLSNVNQYVASMRADENYGVFLSEIDYLKPYLDTHPEDRAFLRRAVADGRVGTGGAYNQFNENTIGGEAIIRNILYGQRMHLAMLGRKSESLALWDVFGHAPQISQIARKAGFSGLVWSKKITGFQPFFYDYALDGSRLLHRRVDYAYSFSGFGSGKNYGLENFIGMTERKFEETRSLGSAVDLRINAADFTPPWTNLAGNVARLGSNVPAIRTTGRAQDLYFRALRDEIEKGDLRPPVTSRDKLFFHVGVGIARSDLKIGQRLTENATLTAEKFATIAHLYGAGYPDLALDKAWRQIFFGSHHDAITGTPSDSAFLDLVAGYREAFELSNSTLSDALDFLARRVATVRPSALPRNAAAPLPVVVFNPLNWRRTDVVRAKFRLAVPRSGFQVRDDRNAIIPATLVASSGNDVELEFLASDVPSLGYRTFFLEPSKPRRDEPAAAAARPTIENEYYRITLDPDRGGAIAGIYDKTAAREIVRRDADGRLGNEIAVLAEELTRQNVVYPAWELWTTGRKSFSGTVKASVACSRDGVGKTCRINGTLPNGTRYVQTVTLRDRVKRIDFRTELGDYAGTGELFTVNFPLDLAGGALVTEDRFGTVVRNSSKGYLDFRTNTDKLVSGAPVYSVNNWAEYGSTLKLDFIGDGGPAAEAKNVRASVALRPAAIVRPRGEAAANAAERLLAALITRGVSATPFDDNFDAARRGRLSIEDSTMPKKLNDDIAYHSFRIVIGDESENAYAAEILKSVPADARERLRARVRRDGFGFLFFYDADVPAGWPAMPVLVVAGDAAAGVAKLVAPIAGGAFAIELPFECFVAETVAGGVLPRVPDYGVALINNGTAGVSLENPGTLTLHLTHTAPFPGVNLGFDFVPENKTHVFTYALFPHEKDWRAAGTVKAGYEFNNPLVAVATDAHAGPLPASGSFLEIDSPGDGVVVTALKLGGSPQADFRSPDGGPRPVILRLNETMGLPAVAKLRTPLAGAAFTRASLADLLEDELPGSQRSTSPTGFEVPVDRFGIETVRLETSAATPRADAARTPLGPTAEVVQPVFARYWMHNGGAAPIGNDAVKVTLRPVEQMGGLTGFAWEDPYNQGGVTTTVVRVQVVNNYQDRRVSGRVALEVPDDWRVVPDSLAYDLEANGSFVGDVAVIAYPVKKNLEFERASGLVKARIEHDGQTFQDVLAIGRPLKLEWRTESTDGKVVVFVKNPNRQSIDGAVALITPPEAWAGGVYSGRPAFPRERGFSVPAGTEIALEFNHGRLAAGTWRIARLVYDGNCEYKRADGKAR